MSRYCVLSFAAVVAVAGCNRAPTTQSVNVPAAARPIAVATEFPELPALPPVGTQVAEPERGTAVLASAFGLFNEGKLPEALAEFKQAQTIQDSGIVRTAIAAIEWRLAAAALADKVATEVRGILDDGRADLAAQLASDALRVFGDGAAADLFASLKRQADSLNMVGMEPPAIAAALKKEFED